MLTAAPPLFGLKILRRARVKDLERSSIQGPILYLWPVFLVVMGGLGPVLLGIVTRLKTWATSGGPFRKLGSR